MRLNIADDNFEVRTEDQTYSREQLRSKIKRYSCHIDFVQDLFYSDKERETYSFELQGWIKNLERCVIDYMPSEDFPNGLLIGNRKKELQQNGILATIYTCQDVLLEIPGLKLFNSQVKRITEANGWNLNFGFKLLRDFHDSQWEETRTYNVDLYNTKLEETIRHKITLKFEGKRNPNPFH